MKYLLIVLFVSTSFAQQSKIKKQIERQYSTYQKNKDELIRHTETGFDKAGNQTYFIDHLTAQKDTVHGFSKNVKKKIGRRTCYYNQNGEILVCRKKKKNIIMLYFPPDLENPVSYELYDKMGVIGGIYKTNYENHPYKKAFVLNRKFDDRKNPTYYTVSEYFLPKGFDPENKRARKISAKGLIQADRSKIFEFEYQYY